MLPILYQDEDLVVVNKCSGLLVHRSTIDRYATEFALQMVRDQIGRQVFPVHRLDRPTSGALIFALSSTSARALAEDFAAGRVEKRYLAVVRGTPALESTVDHPLREELDAKADRMADTNKPARAALTNVTRLGTCEFPVQVDKYPCTRYSLVQATPKTGRRHQVRRHLRHLGHPIIGDVTYGCGKHNRFFENRFKMRRLLLACIEVGFQHPRTKTMTRVKAPLAADYEDLLGKLGWGAVFA